MLGALSHLSSVVENPMKSQAPVSSAPQVSAVFSIAQNKPNISTNPMQPGLNRFTMPQQRPIMPPNANMNMPPNMGGPQPTPMVIYSEKNFPLV